VEQDLGSSHRFRTALGIVQAKTAFDAWTVSGALGSCDLHDVDGLIGVLCGWAPRRMQGHSTQTVHTLPCAGSSACRVFACGEASLQICWPVLLLGWLAGQLQPLVQSLTIFSYGCAADGVVGAPASFLRGQ